ncbi:hypothetical protein AB0N50_30865 [Streptomyces pharetrae]|uniref:hypothetical protein n=1 Tax=Streptomyces pharetrae TaxID=291370 RepID=UPI003460D992
MIPGTGSGCRTPVLQLDRYATSDSLRLVTSGPHRCTTADRRQVVVVEFITGSSIDAGRYRHPARYLCLHDDLPPDRVPPFEG